MTMTHRLDSRDTLITEVRGSDDPRGLPETTEATKPDVQVGTLVGSLTVYAPHVHVEQSEPPAEAVEGVPVSLLNLYADLAVRHAVVRDTGDGLWFASVVGIDGAYGEGTSPPEAERSLHEAVVGWVVVKRRIGATDIPKMEGLDLNLPNDDD